LRASVEFLLEVGIGAIGAAVQRLADQLAEGARRKGYQLAMERSPETGAGIVSIRKNELNSGWVAERLKEKNILVADRHGWVRLSPHFYQTAEEMERAVEALPD
jgi:selenocysteine lyase/cysteine desulfurase